jgi:heptaprenyl diphosphate synthase
MAEGIYTLPVIRAIAAGDDTAGELRELLGRPLTEFAEIERARKLVKASSGIDDAIEVATRYGSEAAAALACLPPSDPLEHLAAAATEMVSSIPG